MATDTTRGTHDKPADNETASASQLLRHALASGDPEVARLVRGILDRPRPVTEAERQRLRRDLTAWYGDDVDRNRAFVAFLEGQDRRRKSARRLPSLCDDDDHGRHRLGCHDPEAAMTG